MSNEIENQFVTREAFRGDFDYDDAQECIDQLQDAVDNIPEEFRDSAKITIVSNRQYDEDYESCEIIVSYQRPETDLEMQQRQFRLNRDNERKLETERAAYERLRKKFEGPLS